MATPEQRLQTVNRELIRIVNGASFPAAGIYELDPVHTFVEFSARHFLIGLVRGRFNDVRGMVSIHEDPARTSLEVHIDASSADTRNTVRDDDVRGPHFLNAAHFPDIAYRSTGAAHSGGNEWLVEGVLTVRGVERVVPVDVTFVGAVLDPTGKTRVGFTANATVRRADFGMVGDLPNEVGEIPVDRDVSIHIDAEAILRT